MMPDWFFQYGSSIRWLLLVGLSVFFVAFVLKWLFGRFVGGSGGSLRSKLKRMYTERHEFRRVRPEDFPKADHAYYNDTQRWFEGQGFTCLGDIEDLTTTQAFPGNRTFMRIFVSPDRQVSAACFHLPMLGFMRLLQMAGVLPKNMCMLEFETEFADGTFLNTNNTLGKNQMDEPPAIRQVQLPDTTSNEELLARHRATIEAWCAEDPALRPVQFRSLDDVIESQHRQQDLKIAWRGQVGLVTKEEMARMARPGEEESARKLLDELRKDDD